MSKYDMFLEHHCSKREKETKDSNGICLSSDGTGRAKVNLLRLLLFNSPTAKAFV